jgi:predicted transcriptional regulator YdeE
MLKIGEFSKLAQVSVKTLRYYHQLGLLKPAWTDRFNGYRYYSLDQLAVLNRILALKELGFSLEQTHTILQEDLSAAELRGMIRLKQAELEQHIQQEQARLKQIENRLRQITQEGALPAYDVVVKPVPSRRVAGLRQTIQAAHQIPEMFLALRAALPKNSLAADPTMPAVGIFYDSEYSERGIDMEAAAPVQRKVAGQDKVAVHQLPGAEHMACVVHKGALESLPQAHLAVAVWADTNRYNITGPNREVYLQGLSSAEETTPSQDLITEVQFPVERKPTPILIQKHQEYAQMEPKIVTKPAFTVVGMKYFGKNENQEIPQLWREFNPRCLEVINKVEPNECYGVCGDLDEAGRFKYLAGYEVSAAEELPADMESWDVPEHEYAVFPCTIPTIGATYEYAHNTWLPSSDYQRSPTPDFEFYDETFDPQNPESVLYVYIPIKKKP